MFEILVNGIARTYRDTEDMAIDAGKVLRGRDKSEITVINQDTRQWLVIVDPYPPDRLTTQIVIHQIRECYINRSRCQYGFTRLLASPTALKALGQFEPLP